MLPIHYVRPVAYHRSDADKLLLKDEQDRWYLWRGDDAGLIEIERAMAQWIYERPEIFPAWAPHMWFDVTTLPATADRPRGFSVG
ncbi:MAG: hypothetical protein H0U31_07970 [Chloroflexia bacterium]|nr:hypothetical protein [Chloroflexia bacterium]